MSNSHEDDAPEWVARFLAALRDGEAVSAAATNAGVCDTTPYKRRETHPAFRAAWDACSPIDGGKRRRSEPVPRRNAVSLDRFLSELAETSNVSAAAAIAGVSVGVLYKLRRSDPDFARRWYAALAEGYDNLEMELLGRLRSGEPDGGGTGKKFDTATALRCLTAHRESVAREKGRRTLAAEVTTIAAINAKIDAMRLKQKGTQKAIAKVRKTKAPKIKPLRHCEEPQATRQSMDRALDVPQQSRLAQAVGVGLPRHPCGAPRNDEATDQNSNG